MNKDAMLATAIGFFIGLCITGILLAGPSLMKMMPKFTIPMPAISQSKTKQTPAPESPITDQKFSVDSPLNESIESGKELLVSGRAAPGSVVVIMGNTDDAVVETSQDGKFAGKVTLSEGKNEITVTGYDKKAQSVQNLTIYYTPESL